MLLLATNMKFYSQWACFFLNLFQCKSAAASLHKAMRSYLRKNIETEEQRTAKMFSAEVPQTILFLGCKNTLLNPECLISVSGIIHHLYFLHKPQMVPYSTFRSRKHLKLLLVSFTKSPLKHGITTFFSHHLTRSLTT